MLLQWSAPEYVPRSFLVSGVSGTNKAVKQTDTSFPLHSAAYSVELFPNASAVLVLKNLTEH